MYGEEANVQTAERIGAIKEINEKVRETTDFATNIARRLQDLRSRLLAGHGDSDRADKGVAPSPVRPDVDELVNSVDILRQVLVDAQDDLTALESL